MISNLNSRQTRLQFAIPDGTTRTTALRDVFVMKS
jgi:hypothetical protein